MTSEIAGSRVVAAVTTATDRQFLEASQRALTRAAADLASFCEHVEHNEPNSIESAVSAGDHLREIASQLSYRFEVSLAAIYAARLRDVEEKSLLRYDPAAEGDISLAGTDALMHVGTWKELQIGQIMHDRQFHPDVFGMSKVDQIRHYTFHVTKLAGLMVDAIEKEDWEAFRKERLADIAIFGVKIATVCNVELPCTTVDVQQVESSG